MIGKLFPDSTVSVTAAVTLENILNLRSYLFV
jgi:hypothetical protein